MFKGKLIIFFFILDANIRILPNPCSVEAALKNLAKDTSEVLKSPLA